MSPHLLKARGQSLVEVALALPVLVILFLGIAEVGFFLYAHVQISNATREGARQASLCRLHQNCIGADLEDAVEAAVFAEARSLQPSRGNPSVSVQPDNLAGVPAVGQPLTVTVTYTHTPPFISDFVPMFPSQIPFQHYVVMHFDK